MTNTQSQPKTVPNQASDFAESVAQFSPVVSEKKAQEIVDEIIPYCAGDPGNDDVAYALLQMIDLFTYCPPNGFIARIEVAAAGAVTW